MTQRFFVATRKGLFEIVKTGGGWDIARASFLGDNVPMMLADPRDGTLYAVLDHGHFGNKLHRSRDNGETWTEVGVPVYPPLPEGRPPDVNPASGKPYTWDLRLIWALEAGGKDRPGELWAGTVPGGLFRSEDAGESWQLVESLWYDERRAKWFGGGMDLPGIHSICVHPNDPNHVSLGISCGGVWITKNRGKTWELAGKGLRAEFMPPELQFDPNIQDAHRLAACASNPDMMWIQHHNGIFASSDGGWNWREITGVEPSSFGFAVAVHPNDGNTAWFVPAIKDEKRIPTNGALCVTRTRNGGQTFQQLRTGLPQKHAYDLIYRHALDIDATGDVLAMGSTTGSIWVSEDGGDNWQTISQHLPPVYAVRFG
jgi:hypothetical protein